MTTLSQILLPEERAVARPPERLTVSEWADKHRIMESWRPRPGRWQTDFNPPVRGIMDAFSDPLCRQIAVMGSTQWGKSESLINCMLWQIDQDPVPIVFVMPNEIEVVAFASNRLKPAVEHSPRMRGYKDPRKASWLREEIRLNGALVTFAWAASTMRLASRDIGLVVADEVDKMDEFTGREASPLSLVLERLRWWEDAKAFFTSTPVLETDYIWPLFLAGDQRRFHVPCALCGAYQVLEFSPETVQWPKDERDPARIIEHRLAWYRCKHCKRELRDEPKTKRRMIKAGVWCPHDGKVEPDGTVKGDLARPNRSFHLMSLYSPMLSWSHTAAEFVRSYRDPALYMNFVNSWLGEPWRQKATEMKLERVASRATPALPKGTVPLGTRVLTAGVDKKAAGYHWSIRAWLSQRRSFTILSGFVDTEDALLRVLFGSVYRDPAGRRFEVRLACVDSSWQPDAVYALCVRAGGDNRCRPIKGVDHLPSPLKTTRVERDWIGRAGGLQLWHLDTSYFKDQFARHVHADLGGPEAWGCHAEPNHEYLSHLCAEHKVMKRRKGSQQTSEEWEKRPGGGENHWLDCECYNQAAGEMLGVFYLKDEEEPPEPEDDKPEPPPGPGTRGERNPFTGRPGRSWIPKTGGWLK